MSKLIFSDRKNWKERLLNTNQRKVINFLNCHDLYHFKKEPLFRRAISGKEDINFIDGFIISLFFSVKKFKRVQRLSGPELIMHFFQEKKLYSKKRHLFIGFNEEDLDKFSEKFPYLNQKRLFAFNPIYIKGINFPENEINKIIHIINSKKIDFVWVGIGCPKQNILTYNLYPKTKAKYFFNVGAGMDFILGKKERAPKWVQKIGLEWLYRLITDFNHSKKKVWRSFVANKYLFRGAKLK